MASTGEPHIVRGAFIALVVATGAVGTFANLGLYADGSYFLLRILADEQMFFGNPDRAFVATLTQLPVVTAMAVGIEDVGVLTRVYSAGLVLLPTAVWAAALWVQWRRPWFWLVAMMWAVTYPVTGVFAVGEYHLTHALVALSAALLLANPGVRRGLLLVGVGVVLLRSYESMLFLGPLLATLTWRVRAADGRPLLRRVLALVAGLHLAAAVWAGTTALLGQEPRVTKGGIVDPPASLSAALNFDSMLGNPRLLLAAAAVAAVALAFTGLVRARFLLVAVAVGSVLAVMHAGHLLGGPVFYYHHARVPVGGLLAVLLAVAIWRHHHPERVAARWWLVPAVTAPVLAVPFVVVSLGFHQWVGDLEREVQAGSGVVYLQDAGLDTGFSWWWATPSLSILLQDDPGQAIVVDDGWPNEPFQPIQASDPIRPAPRFQ